MRTRNKTDKRGFSVLLEIFAAAFILLAPSLQCIIGDGSGIYFAFAAVSLCLGARLVETGRIHISLNIISGALLGAYALLSVAWAENMFGHIRFLFTVFTVVEAAALAADYFELESGRGIARRLTNMLIFSAVICAATSLALWGITDKFKLAAPLGQGQAQNELLGIYMIVGMCCAANELLKGKKNYPNGKFKLSGYAAFMIIVILLFLFVLLMSAAYLAIWIGAVYFAVLMYKIKRRDFLFWAAFAAAICFTGLLAFNFKLIAPPAFWDAMLAMLKNPAGLGGGGFSMLQTQLQTSFYPYAEAIGTGASLASSLGLPGLMAALFFIGREVWFAVKYKDLISAFFAALALQAFFVPTQNGAAWLIMLMCAFVYDEHRRGAVHGVSVNSAAAFAICCVMGAAGLYGGVLQAGGIIADSAARLAEDDERRAAERFSLAASVNIFDAESCFNAANGLRRLYETEGEKVDFVNAEYNIRRAIERDSRNAAYHAEYARLLAAGGDYASACAEDELAAELAPLYDIYKIALAEHTYRYMESLERGGVEAQRCYRQILECADGALDMESKKLINDFADKAQIFTRIDFFEGTEGTGE